MVNAIKLYAADGAHHLQTTEYQLIIGDGTGGTTGGLYWHTNMGYLW